MFRCVNDIFAYCTTGPYAKKDERKTRGELGVVYVIGTCTFSPELCPYYRTQNALKEV